MHEMSENVPVSRVAMRGSILFMKLELSLRNLVDRIESAIHGASQNQVL